LAFLMGTGRYSGQSLSQARLIDSPNGVHPLVDQHDGNLFDIGVEQHWIVEDRQLLERHLGVIGEHGVHDCAGVIAQVASGLAEQGQSGHPPRL
jgi:hypothetical protein